MKKRKKPIDIVDSILYAEAAIRQAVKDWREERCSLYRASRFSGGGGRKKTAADWTANAALRQMEEVPFVVVAGVGSVDRPERWIAAIDRVRESARRCEYSALILNHWEWRYFCDGQYVNGEEVDELIGDENCNLLPWGVIACLRWIRGKVLEEAQKEGLL